MAKRLIEAALRQGAGAAGRLADARTDSLAK
jgi:hypothetical protein